MKGTVSGKLYTPGNPVQIKRYVMMRKKEFTYDDRIHVLYFHHNFAPLLLDIIRGLDQNKFHVTVCNIWDNENFKNDFQKCGVEVVCLSARRVFDPRAWWKLIRLLAHTSPDIIHTILPELSVPVRLISPFITKSIIVHTFHNPLSSEQALWRLTNLLTLRLCDAITGVSTGVTRKIILQRPKLAHKIMVTPNGIDMEEYFSCVTLKRQSLRDELDIGSDEILLGCVGRITYQKGQDILIKAMGMLKLKGVQTKLILAGPDYGDFQLQGLISTLNLEKEIIFLGWRDDIARILADIDIYVAPSRWEGFNIALSEAMLSGVPCIATALPGHSELLFDNETAIAVPKGSEKKVAEAILWTLDHPREAKRMAAYASNFVKREFTAEKMSLRYEQLYLRLMRGETPLSNIP